MPDEVQEEKKVAKSVEQAIKTGDAASKLLAKVKKMQGALDKADKSLKSTSKELSAEDDD
jgi:seryl-tRNA synthetase